jgi:hypothetical protein
MKLASLTALVVAIALTSGAGAAGAAGEVVTLRGYGTADVDGVLTLNEWDDAGRYAFHVESPPGGGSGTFYVMNDSTNLYLALRVAGGNFGNSVFDAIFLAPPPDVFGSGSDILRVTPTSFEDIYFHPVTPTYRDWLADKADGGTRDGTAVVRVADGEVVYEIAHPLDSADNAHDFSLPIPSHVEFGGAFQSCLGCGGNYIPATFGQIVVVSGTHVPPETTITSGPADWAELSSRGQFGFVGDDDVAPPSELVYQCKIDERDWRECTSPIGSPISPLTTEDGWHTFSVRALDDMLNADPTPATRFWRVDTHGPSRPKVVVLGGRGAAKKELRISATDPGTPAGRLRFRCRVDTKPFRACGSRLRLRLPLGRHVFRVHAIDPAGNGSDVKIVRLVVR